MKYNLDRIFARLKETSECVIAMQFLMMNLEHKLRVLLTQFWKTLFSKASDPLEGVCYDLFKL